MTDSHQLGRFVDAQEGIYECALAELRAGAKRSHWMWFVFPQIAGLGSSPMAQRYAIGSLAEAEAYAKEVIHADFEEAGDEDVIRKLLGDLTSAQVDVDEQRIRETLEHKSVEARRQLMKDHG